MDSERKEEIHFNGKFSTKQVIEGALRKGVCSILFTKDQKYIVLGGHFSHITVYNYENDNATYKGKLNAHSGRVKTLCERKDKTILSAGSDLKIGVWDLTNLKLLKMIMSGHTDIILKVVETKDEKLVTCSGDKTIRLFDKQDQFITEMKGHSDMVLAICVLNDNTLVSGSQDKKLLFWNLDLYQNIPEYTINDVTCWTDREMGYLPEKELLIVGGKDEIKFVDVIKHQVIKTLDSTLLGGIKTQIECVMFLKNGNFIFGIGEAARPFTYYDSNYNLIENPSYPLTHHSVWTAGNLNKNILATGDNSGNLVLWEY